MHIVETLGITKIYELGKARVHALRGVDLAVDEGDFLTVAGPSGSGKSTLLHIIGCLDRPSEGEVRIGGESVTEFSDAALNGIRLRTIGFVFQSFNLIPVLDVCENVELPLLIRKDIGPKERRARVERFVEEVGLREQRRQRPSELSGGQRQRVAIARALAGSPEIVLADEPTANLDSATGLGIVDLMHRINRKEGTTFVFSTHDPRIIERASRVVRLVDGRKDGEETR
jgi:putative ABC transport system ATP-binding protein